MPNKSSNSTALILRDVFNKMGIPKAIASYDGGEFKGRIKEILNAEGILHIIMTTHLSFIDRFTRTIKKYGIWQGSTHKKRVAHIASTCN